MKFFSNFANAIDENGMFSEAAKFTQQGNYSEAEKIYKKLLNGSSPQRAATMIGTIAEEQGKYPEAIKWYKKSGDSIARFFSNSITLADCSQNFILNIRTGIPTPNKIATK